MSSRMKRFKSQFREQQREVFRQASSVLVKQVYCHGCGDYFSTTGNQKFCSPECKKKAQKVSPFSYISYKGSVPWDWTSVDRVTHVCVSSAGRILRLELMRISFVPLLARRSSI